MILIGDNIIALLKASTFSIGAVTVHESYSGGVSYPMLVLDELPGNGTAKGYAGGRPRIVRNVLTLEAYAKAMVVNGKIVSKKAAAMQLLVEADNILSKAYGLTMTGQIQAAPYSDQTVFRVVANYVVYIDSQTIAEKNQQIEETARQVTVEEQKLTDSIGRAIEEHKEQFGSAGAFSNKAADLGAVMPDYEEETSVPTKSALKSKGAPYSIDDRVKSLKATMNAVDGVSEKAMNRISMGSSRAAGFVDRLKQSFSGVKEKLSGLNSTSNSFFSMGRFYGWYFIMRQAANTFGGWINNINSFIENQNLFAVAMGKSAQFGRQLATSLQSVLGVDSGESMRYMGLFQQMATSSGITNKQATIMSKNFTQLGYDLASFYNISTKDAFKKLQSGLAGQTRSLRTLGIDISQARLQQELYSLGMRY